MRFREHCLTALLLCGIGLTLAHPAGALLDLPTSDRQALDIAELAAGSGVSRPADTAQLPLDDEAYLEAHRALAKRGLHDPAGDRLGERATTLEAGRFQLGTLRPRLDLRSYVFKSIADQRTLYHSNGDGLKSGVNTFIDASGSASWSTWLGAAYNLQLHTEPGDLEYTTKRLYAKATWGKWSFKMGRDAERLGPGYHGSLLLDDTAATMNLVRVRTEQPLFLPGKLASIGGFRFSLFNGFLSDDSPRPPDRRYGSGVDPVKNARLLGTRFSYHPNPWVDLGLSRTIMYGGDGRASYGLQEWLDLFTGRNENVFDDDHRFDNDQYAAVDITLRLPALNGLGPLRGGKVYWEHAGTDIIAKWQGDDTGSFVPFKFNRVANLGGLYLTTAVTDLRVEYAQTSSAWYRHGQYSQGYTYRGIPLGHHMGGDATNWFFSLSRYFGPRLRAHAELDLEERGSSRTRIEKRTEWTLRLDALQLEVLGHTFQATADVLVANINTPLDDPAGRSRNEYALGFGIRAEL